MRARFTVLLPLLLASCGGLPGWERDRVSEAVPGFLAGCAASSDPGPLAPACSEAARLPPGDEAAARVFLARHFEPVPAGEGLITGYYEPVLRVSPVPAPGFTAPLLATAPGAPDLDRASIEAAVAAGEWPGAVLAWADPVDAFFLQIQGSGRAVFPDGTARRLGYAGKNGHPYVPVGRLLIERGAMTREEVSMQSIRAWLRAAPPADARALMDANPSWVFFRWRDDLPAEGGPAGTLGAPLPPGRAVAVDRSHVPLGSPMWIATRDPLTGGRLERLVIALDTGGAIRGPARADLFWGWGDAAGEAAGRMRETGRIWVLRPRVTPGPRTPGG
ncbi:murein transglycosylase A [Pararoseomonas indoligenes]|uniref:murein transglycosylase A n=1 Tax=Roseomonas indoligenes TaxID=2820811 RepID=UPI001FD77BD7|nr:MltA domain-containing protein [Pararoseomonas indoligenes]